METHEWIKCEYCDGTGRNKNSITGSCFFCSHPMIEGRKPGYRFVKIKDIPKPE